MLNSKDVKVTAIIIAAGSGKRMKSSTPKQFLLLEGKPIIWHTLSVFQDCEIVEEIVLVANREDIPFLEDFKKVKKVVPGGWRRQDSSLKGLEAAGSEAEDIVIFHDGVRPFVRRETILECVREVKRTGAAICALRPKETVKVGTEGNLVRETLDRKNLWLVQTPQVFKADLIRRGFENAKEKELEVTDEAMLIEQLGYPVKIVEGDEENIKITTPDDLILAKAILKGRECELA